MSYQISLCIFQNFSENRNYIMQEICFEFLSNQIMLVTQPASTLFFIPPPHPQAYILTLHSCLGVLGDKEGSGTQPATGVVCVSDNTTMTTWSPCGPVRPAQCGVEETVKELEPRDQDSVVLGKSLNLSESSILYFLNLAQKLVYYKVFRHIQQ